MTLTDAAILALERRFYRLPGSKDAAIRSELDMSPTRFYQRLDALLDTPEAVALDPVTVHRLRRLRAGRMAARGHGS